MCDRGEDGAKGFEAHGDVQQVSGKEEVVVVAEDGHGGVPHQVQEGLAHTQRQRYGKTVMYQDVSPPFVQSPTPFIRQTLHSTQTYIVGKHHSHFPDVVLGVD